MRVFGHISNDLNAGRMAYDGEALQQFVDLAGALQTLLSCILTAQTAMLKWPSLHTSRAEQKLQQKQNATALPDDDPDFMVPGRRGGGIGPCDSSSISCRAQRQRQAKALDACTGWRLLAGDLAVEQDSDSDDGQPGNELLTEAQRVAR